MRVPESITKKIPWMVSLLFILLFVYAAVSKLIDHPKFYNDLINSFVFDNQFISKIISWVIPVLELVTALLLVIPKFNKMGLYMALVLMIGFTLYIGITLLITEFGIADLPCSCGGILSHLSWPHHLLFNTFFVLLGIMGIYPWTNKNKHIKSRNLKRDEKNIIAR
ncbi:MauE/DoxX family redox-associated membrane protein [Gelidibacter sp.]|uniref:MauE/DoxX family redox-associated membrane protein n=1 Tax=Gelidibacter sp. TaxID=2018083 RepID=UPI002CDC44E5|nr:MauE/DoxX family redox-associated membrane protein [Gelidibacter sp.]HUH28764.1 MauE/DoxX family redox-associated membrane protein [Gelidibacter sp.]